VIWLLGGYMWLFIHRPFEVWRWLGELHVERVYMLGTIAYWAIAADKQWISNRLNAAFVFFWIVLLAAWFASPFSAQGTGTVENYFKVAVFYVLVMSTVRSEKDLKLLLMMFLGAMALYMAHSLREYHCGRGESRMGTWRMIGVDASGSDPNSFGATIAFSLPIVFPLWYDFCSYRVRLGLAGYVALAAACILLTGSRGAFLALSALAMTAVLLSKRRATILLVLIIAAPVAWNLLPEDRQNRYLTIIDPSRGPANAQVSAESRWQGWHDGVRMWQEHPFFGTGPGAFGLARGYDLQSHQLYGQVLGELGTLGAMAFGTIVLCFLLNYLDMRQICRQEPDLRNTLSARLIQAVVVTVALLLLLGFAGHNLYRYTWLWFGAFQGIALHVLQTRVNELSIVAIASPNDPLAIART
jgi:O-antigen ligase